MNLETLKSLDKKYAQAIADELLKRIETDDCLKDKLLETSKTLKGCIDYIKSEAKKQASGDCAILTDDEVFQMAQHYFLEDSINNEPKAVNEEPKKSNKASKEDNDSDDEELEEEEAEEISNTPEVVEVPKEVEKPKAEEPKKPSKKETVKKKLEEQVTLFDFMF